MKIRKIIKQLKRKIREGDHPLIFIPDSHIFQGKFKTRLIKVLMKELKRHEKGALLGRGGTFLREALKFNHMHVHDTGDLSCPSTPFPVGTITSRIRVSKNRSEGKGNKVISVDLAHEGSEKCFINIPEEYKEDFAIDTVDGSWVSYGKQHNDLPSVR